MVGANENEENTENNVFLEETSILYPLKQYLEGMDSFFLSDKNYRTNDFESLRRTV